MAVPVPVLTAVSGAVWEADLVAALDGGGLGVQVVRRCVDLADLLATASTGSARAVLLSADLRRLDREALSRLAGLGLAVVGLVLPEDEAAERRLRQLGVVTVLPADAAPDEVAAAVVQPVGGPLPSLGAADVRSFPRQTPPEQRPDTEPAAASGRVVAVWGPTGAPGRSTVALGLAAELAGLGTSALLVDADVYGGVVAQVLGLLDEAPGLAAACRLANSGGLDLPALGRLAITVTPRLRVLSGITRADRWPELRPSGLELVLSLARRLAAVTVVDCGFALEQDEELAYDTAAPRRNGATLTALEQADTVVAVGSADPVGLQRLVRGLADLRELLPGSTPTVVVNRLRGSAIPGDAAREVRAALTRYAGVEDVLLVPYDRAGLDAALQAGRTLPEAAPGSPARAPLAELARAVACLPAPTRRRGLLRR